MSSCYSYKTVLYILSVTQDLFAHQITKINGIYGCGLTLMCLDFFPYKNKA